MDPNNLKISPLEADKKQFIEVPYKDKELSSQTLSKLSLFLSLQEKVQSFFEPSTISDLNSSLKGLKTLFEELMQNDLSQSYQFAEALSKHWHGLIDYVADHSRVQDLTELKKFIRSIHNFPQHVDHSLGFYLTQLLGEDWLPFPFMEILHILHEEALLSPFKSHLLLWIKDIDNILLR